MMTSSNENFFPRYWLFVRGIPWSLVFPSQRASNADFDVSLMWVRISCSTDSRMAGDLRLHDVRVTWLWWMSTLYIHVNTWGTFYYHELTLIPAWIRHHMPSKIWDEVTNPFPNFNGFTVDVCERRNYFILQFIMDVITHSCSDSN